MEKSKNTRTQSPRSVAPDTYHTDVARDIVFAKVITKITDEHINATTAEDRGLITLREFLVNSDNASLHEYVRDVRELLISLRQQYIDVNNEMKSTLRVQSKLEKCLDELRKDSVVNNACSQLRELRPRREKDLGANDQIDDLLKQERTKQQFLKKNLQELLQSTIAQVNELSESRNMLYTVIEEREKVCGYINCSVAGVEYRKMMRKKAAIKKGEEIEDQIQDLPCYTDAADEALKNADHIKKLAKAIRKRVKDEILTTQSEQKLIHKSINQTLRQKTVETRDIKAKLTLQMGQNRLSLHRAERGVHLAKKSHGVLAGPEMSKDLTHRERASRNIVQSFEKHYPKSVSQHETEQIRTAKASLSTNIKTTNDNIRLLMAAQSKLKKQLHEKSSSERNEQNVARYRRSKADHRWVIGEKSKNLQDNIINLNDNKVLKVKGDK